MGGHGGLNILPQKRWNVYNFDNREKVRKDEEEAARQEQQEQRLARQRDSEFRLEKLREIAHAKRLSAGEGAERGGDAGEGSQDGEPGPASIQVVKIEHINLFKDVEERQTWAATKPVDRKRKDDEGRRKEGKGKQEPLDASDEQYRFGYGTVSKNAKRPWYLTKSFVLSRADDDESEDEDEARRAPSRSQGKKRKTVEELRSERLKREEQEKSKVRKLMSAQASSSQGQGRGSRYYQSYGNAR